MHADIQQQLLWQIMAGDLAERLAAVTRDFADILLIGPIAAFAAEILSDRDVKPQIAALCPEERDTFGGEFVCDDNLPFADGQFDLIITAGTLDSVNDLPGSLIQIRRALKPDGLMLASLFGAGTLRSLKQAMLLADGPRVGAHIHPQIELRSAADLLSRTGYALPVADIDYVSVRYRMLRTLVNDLRRSGLTNKLAGSRPYLGKGYPERLEQAWLNLADNDGKVTEQFALISLSGWSPSPSQPAPARRGSGTVSLAEILKPKT
jgi:NADH dehydrogenase [ubiquinone] 1 alpha subcomplex assembly factor 5